MITSTGRQISIDDTYTDVDGFLHDKATDEILHIDHFRACDAHTLVDQIGRMTILSISGGRVLVRETGITLRVSNGYSVTVDLAANDTYTVRRMFKRGAKTWIKGEQRGVYCEQVSEAAYQASCFRNLPFGI